jgi:hypothetical protein
VIPNATHVQLEPESDAVKLTAEDPEALVTLRYCVGRTAFSEFAVNVREGEVDVPPLAVTVRFPLPPPPLPPTTMVTGTFCVPVPETRVI